MALYILNCLIPCAITNRPIMFSGAGISFVVVRNWRPMVAIKHSCIIVHSELWTRLISLSSVAGNATKTRILRGPLEKRCSYPCVEIIPNSSIAVYNFSVLSYRPHYTNCYDRKHHPIRVCTVFRLYIVSILVCRL